MNVCSCYSPLYARLIPAVNPKTGEIISRLDFIFGFEVRQYADKCKKRGEKFILPDGVVSVPCGKCVGCRVDYARNWSIRCLHEASLHAENSFITLTYSPENLPDYGSLVRRDLSLFVKRLRKKFGAGIRYFACGEYGSEYLRPHYHICFFGFRPPDLEPYSRRSGNVVLYTSKIVTDLWRYGFITVGDVTRESCAYVARYVTKKIYGERGREFYESRGIIPEYVVMSRRPGIAKEWFDKYKNDVFPNDYVVDKDFKCKPPRYYDNLYDIYDSEAFQAVKEKRLQKLLELRDAHSEEFTPNRLDAKALVKEHNMQRLRRDFENGVLE